MALSLEAGIALATTIIEELVKVAPAIEQGFINAEPYAQALGGIISGTNATQDDVDGLLEKLKADSADFQTPLPPDGDDIVG